MSDGLIYLINKAEQGHTTHLHLWIAVGNTNGKLQALTAWQWQTKYITFFQQLWLLNRMYTLLDQWTYINLG